MYQNIQFVSLKHCPPLGTETIKDILLLLTSLEKLVASVEVDALNLLSIKSFYVCFDTTVETLCSLKGMAVVTWIRCKEYNAMLASFQFRRRFDQEKEAGRRIQTIHRCFRSKLTNTLSCILLKRRNFVLEAVVRIQQERGSSKKH